MRGLSRIFETALFELFSSLRSRRALVTVVLFLAASLLSMNGAISALGKLERQVSEVLQLPSDDKAGVVSTTLWKSSRFQSYVRSVVGDSLVYDDICGRHPAELLYAFFAFLYIPLLTILVSANRIADDLHSGAVRYMITRVTRLEWSLGKFAGSALLMLAALLLNGVAAWCVAALRLSGADSVAILPGMLMWSIKGWFLSIPYLGMALGVSHLTRSGAKATAFGIIAVFVLSLAPKLIAWLAPAPAAHLLRLFPSNASDPLWRTSFVPVASSAIWLAMLGLLYLSAGYAFFARRDAR